MKAESDDPNPLTAGEKMMDEAKYRKKPVEVKAVRGQGEGAIAQGAER